MAVQGTASAGTAIVLTPTYAIRLQVSAMFTQPSPVVTIGTSDSFRAGRPMLLFGIALERGFPDLAGVLNR